MIQFLIILGIIGVLGFLASVFLDRVLNPWLGRRWAEKILNKIQSGKFQPPHFDVSIVWDSEGFFVQQDKTQEKSPNVAWAEIVKVTIFKRDLWTTDRICLILEKADETGLEVHEEMNGFSKFAEELSKWLVGCKPLSEWIWNVSTPAFKTNAAEIFSRCEKPSIGDSP
jgi:hypothetical protein